MTKSLKPKFLKYRDTKAKNEVHKPCVLYVDPLFMCLCNQRVYDQIMDILWETEEIDKVFDVRVRFIDKDEYELLAEHMFKLFGRKAKIKLLDLSVWVIGQIPDYILHALRTKRSEPKAS